MTLLVVLQSLNYSHIIRKTQNYKILNRIVVFRENEMRSLDFSSTYILK